MKFAVYLNLIGIGIIYGLIAGLLSALSNIDSLIIIGIVALIAGNVCSRITSKFLRDSESPDAIQIT